MLCKMPVIIGAAVGGWLCLHNLSIVGFMIGIVGFAITSFMESAGGFDRDSDSEPSKYDG